MRTTIILAGFVFAGIAAKAQSQEGVITMKVTDDLRKRFAQEAHLPDPSEIIYETAPQLLKSTNVALHDPDPSIVSYETPPALRKRSLTLTPAPSTEPTK